MQSLRDLNMLLAAIALTACGSSTTTGTDAGATDVLNRSDTSVVDTGMGSNPDVTSAPIDVVASTDVAEADTGETVDAGPPNTTPLATPNEQWTWVPIAGARCGNGTPTGIGVNLTTRSSRVLIYLEGGGACWSGITCFTLQTAANFTTGYGATNFATEVADPGYIGLPGGMFDRTSTANPFQDYSYIYVPYCTGDVHAGNSTQTYGTPNTAYHVGYVNMGLALDRIVPTFPTAERVYIAGSSAGGFGALFNWYRTQQAFGSIRVDLIDDSGTPMPADVLTPGGNISVAAAAWNLGANIPAGCPDCVNNLDHAVGWLAQQFPTHKAALLQYEMDTVLPTYFGINLAGFEMGLNEVIANQITPNSNFQYFEKAAAGHVLWFSPSLSQGGTSVQQFLTQMTTDSPSWASVHP